MIAEGKQLPDSVILHNNNNTDAVPTAITRQGPGVDACRRSHRPAKDEFNRAPDGNSRMSRKACACPPFCKC